MYLFSKHVDNNDNCCNGVVLGGEQETGSRGPSAASVCLGSVSLLRYQVASGLYDDSNIGNDGRGGPSW
jgi:hypothetical protein